MKKKKSFISGKAITITIVIITSLIAIFVIIKKTSKSYTDINTISEEVENYKKYELCINSAAQSYTEQWNKTCKNEGKREDCQLPSDISKTYDDSLENEYDRCATIYGPKLENSEELYNRCRTDVYNEYKERWNTTCKAKDLEDDCSLPIAVSSSYEDSKDRGLNRCIVLFQQ